MRCLLGLAEFDKKYRKKGLGFGVSMALFVEVGQIVLKRALNFESGCFYDTFVNCICTKILCLVFLTETQQSQSEVNNYLESIVDGVMPNATLKRTIVSSAGEK